MTDAVETFIQHHVSDTTNIDEIRAILRQYEPDVIERTDTGLRRFYQDPELHDHLIEYIGWVEKTYIEAEAIELFGYLMEQYRIPLGANPHSDKLSRFGNYLARYVIAIAVANALRNVAPLLARKLAAKRQWKPGGAEQDRYNYITTANPDADIIAYVSSVVDGDDEAARKILGGGSQPAVIVARIGELLLS